MRTLVVPVAAAADAVTMLGDGDHAVADVLYPDVVYSTGFEAPTYTTGTLSGQDGWFNNGGGSVQTGTVFSGAQAAGYNATGISGQHQDFHTVPSAGQTLGRWV